eukprot:2480595-Pyramimonas_sp.AAC.1
MPRGEALKMARETKCQHGSSDLPSIQVHDSPDPRGRVAVQTRRVRRRTIFWGGRLKHSFAGLRATAIAGGWGRQTEGRQSRVVWRP